MSHKRKNTTLQLETLVNEQRALLAASDRTLQISDSQQFWKERNDIDQRLKHASAPHTAVLKLFDFADMRTLARRYYWRRIAAVVYGH